MTETPTMAAQVTHLAAVRDVLHAILGAQPDDIQPHHTLHEDLVCDDLEEAVDRFDQRPAVEDERRSVTYREFDQMANSFCHWARVRNV